MYTITAAKASLSRLIREAQNGKEVVIGRRNLAVAKIVPIRTRTGKRIPGKFKGKLVIKPSFFDPMTRAELKRWGL